LFPPISAVDAQYHFNFCSPALKRSEAITFHFHVADLA